MKYTAMSKGSDGPAASTFTNPRKKGWLYKHGGSGFSSHWKKRWFVADHHYLFYYKNPNDKKPVGILCLPEYGSCQKADVKEWKKPYTFMLGRVEGTQENADSGASSSTLGKDYVLYSETEGDMNTWIEALKEEMKPSALFINDSQSSFGIKGAVKVDQQALEEVTKAASDGPKLTHLTAQRPRVRGRRPPRRYVTYHEEDKDDSPPDTPTTDHRVVTTPLQPPSPSASSSPTSQKKGHRPAIPLMPKERSLTSSPPPLKEPPKNIKKIPPTPPSKPTEKEAEALQTSPLLKQRPIPPKRPLKPRASTDAPVAAPRPVPTPRRAGGKDMMKSPLREVSDEIMKDKTNVLELPVVSNMNTESHEQVESQKDDTEIIASEMNEKTETIEEESAEAVLPEITTDNDMANTDTVSKNSNNNEAPTPPSNVHVNLPVEETVYQKSVSEGTCPKSPNASSTDEYEHMRPGVTKDKSSSHKETPEYEEPEEWNLESPKQINSGGYATPYPVPKTEEAAYDMPVTPIKVDFKTLPPPPQVPVLATVNEEKLTAGRGKSPPLPRSSTGEDQLKPFQMERDSLGYTKVVKQKPKGSNEPDGLTQSDDDNKQPLWSEMENGLMTNDVPSTLHQSREILRLAQIMKQEVEDMRREVQQELEMARRERQDAELLKKNATEILRMAKEKLQIP